MKTRSKILVYLAWSAGTLIVLGLPPSAANAQIAETTLEVTPATFSPGLRLRNRGPDELPRVTKGLQAQAFARALGNIADMALGDRGEIYAIDRDKGRLTELVDRDIDGHVDMTRILASGFKNPAGLIAVSGQLFVADENAIWKVDIASRQKTEFVSLRNIQNASGGFPMILHPNGAEILLAISEKQGRSKIISIDIFSGQAKQIADGPARISAIAMTKGTPLWAAAGSQLFPIQGGVFQVQKSVDMPGGHKIEKLYLPTNGNITAPGLGGLSGQFLVVQDQIGQTSRNGISGRNLVAIASSFGLPEGNPVPVIDGFLDQNERSAWGKPGALIWDERGLFLADSQNGTLWRISKEALKVKIAARREDPIKLYEVETIKKAKASWGSSIKTGSSIITGSRLEENWEDSKLIKSDTLMGKMRAEEKEEMSEKSGSQDINSQDGE